MIKKRRLLHLRSVRQFFYCCHRHAACCIHKLSPVQIEQKERTEDTYDLD